MSTFRHAFPDAPRPNALPVAVIALLAADKARVSVIESVLMSRVVHRYVCASPPGRVEDDVTVGGHEAAVGQGHAVGSPESFWSHWS